MLKKLSVALCVASAFGVGVAQAGSGSGQIIFTGAVKESPPEIIVQAEGGSPFGLDNLSSNVIQLGEYYYAELDNGEFPTKHTKAFSITLKRKGVVTNYFSTVAFTFSADNVNAQGIIKNADNSTGAAENVGVAVRYLGAQKGLSSTIDETGKGMLFTSAASADLTISGIAHQDFDPVSILMLHSRNTTILHLLSQVLSMRL